MHLEAQPMTQGVAERLAEPPGSDDLASQGVTFPGRHSGPEVLDSPPLGRLDEIVNHALQLVSLGSDYRGPGQIGTVSVHLGAEVDQEQLTSTNRPLGGAGVGECRPGS